MSSITIEQVTRRFGETVAVSAVDLAIEHGELFFLLGPSGCGKTTLLRMIAGFIAPTAGRIAFDQRDVTTVPPNRRNTGMVFQSYALWPHMTVAENVAYGLNVRRVKGLERSERVRRALRSVQMEEYDRRKPNQLSGGQQQRVALARALVIEPTVLLLDEPLSNLDAKLRLEMRSEIRRICKETGITTVYVTHDQKEALSMADRIAVLQRGKVIQVDPPRALYDRPVSRFVAEFVGETNFIEATVREASSETVLLDTPAGPLESTAGPADLGAGDRVTCSLRPEALRLRDDPSRRNQLIGKRLETIYLGEQAQHLLELPDGSRLRVLELHPGPAASAAEAVQVSVSPADVVILRGSSDEAAKAPIIRE